MSVSHKILYNTFIQIAGRAAAVVCSVIIIGIVSRYLGVASFGKYTTVIVFAQLFTVFADLGLGIIMTQLLAEANQEDEARLASNIFSFRLLTMLILLVIGIGCSFIVPYEMVVRQGIIIVSVSFLFNALGQVLGGIYQKYLAMSRYALAEVINKVVMLGFVIISVRFDWGLLGIVFASVMGALLGLILDYWWVRQYVRVRWQLDLRTWWQIWQRSWPLGVSVIVTTIYFKADTLLVNYFWGDTATGIYGAPYRVLEVLIQVPYIFVGLILPFMVQEWAAKRRDSWYRFVQVAFDGVVLLGLPLVVGGYFFAEKIMVLLAGNEFLSSGPVLQVLLVAMFFIFVATVFNHVLLAINEQRRILVVLSLGMVVSLVGYFILIPSWSYWGAATVTVLGECFVMVAGAVMVYRLTGFVPQWIGILQAVFATGIMAIWLQIFSNWPWWILFSSGAIIYVAVLYIIGAFKRLDFSENAIVIK